MTANDAPQVVLIAGLTHDLEVLSAVVQLDLHALTRPAGPLLPARAGSPVAANRVMIATQTNAGIS
jgi:hypothetical protein